MTNLKLEFHKSYLNTKGEVVEIIKIQEGNNSEAEYIGRNGICYDSSGKSREYADFDLISELNEKQIEAIDLVHTLITSSASRAFDELRLWGEKTFGQTNPLRIIQRAKEEMDQELIPLLEKTNEWNEKSVEEVADVVVILTRVPGLWSAIIRKSKINCERDWNLKGDGTGYHIPKETGD